MSLVAVKFIKSNYMKEKMNRKTHTQLKEKPGMEVPSNFAEFEILVKVKWRGNENTLAHKHLDVTEKNHYESNNYYELSYVLRCFHMFDS